ncbi:putative endonuclease containing a URI domain [Vibrio sp. JCM 19053]|nr:putative endonuclease containing a URI domain [Vibrio sp. JCM 19053]
MEWSSDFESKTLAMRAEYYIKQLTKAKKKSCSLCQKQILSSTNINK